VAEAERGRSLMYETGIDFYKRKIVVAAAAVENADSVYSKIIAQEELEEAQLKLSHLIRRSELLK